MKLKTMWELLKWARGETKNHGCTASDILADLRSKVDEIELEKD